MKPISVLLLIGGLLLGGLGTFAALQVTKSDVDLLALKQDVDDLQKDNARLKKLLALEKKKNNELVVAEVNAETIAPEPVEPEEEKEKNPVAGIVEMLSDEDKAREGFALIVQGMGKNMRTRMIEGRMNQLSERLGLNDDQKKSIGKLMDERGAALQELMVKKLQKKATDADFSKFSGLGSFGGQIQDYLEPDQQAIYAEVQQEERAQAIEQGTRREVRTLQRVPDLTEEQEQEASAILQGQVEQETPSDSTDNFERMVMTREEEMVEMEQARLDALEPVLTTEQLDAYGTSMEQQRQQRMRFGGMGPGGGGFRR